MSLSVHIRKKLGAFHLAVDFDTASESLGLLGASGCGKSVTLNCISGVMTPDSGHIELNGRVLFDSGRHINVPPQKRRIGYMFQQYALFPNMTVSENILTGVRSGTRSEKHESVKRAVEKFRLEKVAGHYPATLSGGEKQRTALARILVGEPELLLLDEPFSALDSYLKWQLLWEMTEYLRSFTGNVLFVSHDKEELSKLCSSVCVLDRGHSEPVRNLETLLKKPDSVASAKLAGFKNIIPGSVKDGIFLSPAWNLSIPCSDPTVRAVCLREEHLLPGRTSSSDIAVSCMAAGYTGENGRLLLMLRPQSGSEGPLLCMHAPDQSVSPGDHLTVYLLHDCAVLLINSAESVE